MWHCPTLSRYLIATVIRWEIAGLYIASVDGPIRIQSPVKASNYRHINLLCLFSLLNHVCLYNGSINKQEAQLKRASTTCTKSGI